MTEQEREYYELRHAPNTCLEQQQVLNFVVFATGTPVLVCAIKLITFIIVFIEFSEKRIILCHIYGTNL